MMARRDPIRVLILGGGFGGVYTALRLEQAARHHDDLEVTLVSRENFFLFTPMLHEVAASDLDPVHIVNPYRKLLRRTRFVEGEVDAVDLETRTVRVSHGPNRHVHALVYDHLVVALGAVTNFYNLPGLEAHALTMKTLGDAMTLRNRLIESLEAADFECAAGDRDALLTFVVAGGGFAGVETVAGVNDFLRDAIRFYSRLSDDLLRIVLVHDGPVILPELDESLGRYAEEKLRARGVTVQLARRVEAASADAVRLSDGSTIRTATIVWTAGTAAHPLLASLPCTKERGRLAVDQHLRVPGYPGLWALGDCAAIRDEATGRPYPPTAQHALREGRVLADNILATVTGRPLRAFAFKTIGQLAAIGRRTGVASIFGWRFSGFAAWWLWRTIYLSKLPRFEKKLRVALDWTLDLLFSKDLVQLTDERRSRAAAQPDATAPAYVRSA